MNKIIVFLLVFFFFSSVDGQTVPSPELRIQTFEKVWQTVNDNHFDPDFGGVDWKKIGETYKSKVISAKNETEFYSALQDMLNELQQSHFSVIPPNAQITPTIFGDGEIGINLQLIENQAVITRIDANSTAAQSGLRSGFIIKRINEKTVTEILAPLEEKLALRKITDAQKMQRRTRALLSVLSGKIGSIVKIEAIDEKNKIRTFQIERIAFSGEMSPALGGLPAQRIIFESTRLPSNIGYIRFNIWVLPQMAKLQEALKILNNARGIIIDLRGNPGGFGAMTTGLAGLLVQTETSLGTNKNRTEETNLIVYPQENSFKGKLIILTDSGTGSASEVFTAGMQGIKRAKVIGETTSGAVLPSVIEKLPTGATFLYAIADYKSPDKALVEGRGVKPDIEVKLTRKSLLKGQDLQLETAIKEIQKNK